MRRRHLPALLGATLLAPALARAQGGNQGGAWPTRQTIRIVVPFPPGGFSDGVSRLMANAMGGIIGQSVVVENRPGAGGTVGADHIAKSAADGYSLGVSHVSPHGTAGGVYPQLPYDPIGDFAHLAMVCETPTLILVRRDSPLRTFEDWRKAATGPGLRYGTSGIGSIGHLQGEVVARRIGATKLDHVPYRGTAPAIQDLLAGSIESVFDPLAGLVPQITGNGPLRALALSATRRLPALPDLPLLSEVGLGDATATAWMGFSAPKGLPADIARRLTEATVAGIARPEVRQRMEELAVFPPEAPLTGEAFTGFIREFGTKWAAVAKAANIVAS